MTTKVERQRNFNREMALFHIWLDGQDGLTFDQSLTRAIKRRPVATADNRFEADARIAFEGAESPAANHPATAIVASRSSVRADIVNAGPHIGQNAASAILENVRG